MVEHRLLLFYLIREIEPFVCMLMEIYLYSNSLAHGDEIGKNTLPGEQKIPKTGQMTPWMEQAHLRSPSLSPT